MRKKATSGKGNFSPIKGWMKWYNIVGLVACFGLMCFVALRRDGMLFGEKITSAEAKSATEQANQETPDASTGATVHATTGATAKASVNRIVTDTVVSSEGKEVNVRGYNGDVPVEVTIKDKKIVKVEPLENQETPGFFKKVTSSGILDSWNGKTPEEARSLKVDAVSGATYSSKALIANVRAAVADIDTQPKVDLKKGEKGVDSGFTPTWQWIVSLIVVVLGCVVPIFTRNKKYRIVQLILNVGVLGFLTGTFLSFSLVTNVLSQGIADWTMSLVALTMLFAAFVMPLVGKPRHYCLWICPLGSAQELMGKMIKHKPHIGATTAKILTRVRDIL